MVTNWLERSNLAWLGRDIVYEDSARGLSTKVVVELEPGKVNMSVFLHEVRLIP